MIHIFKHNKQTFILNSDDIVNISDININSQELSFNIILKTNYIHHITFPIKYNNISKPTKYNYVFDKFKSKIISEYHNDRRMYKTFDTTYDSYVKYGEYDEELYNKALIEYDKQLKEQEQDLNIQKIKIENKIQDLIRILYPDNKICNLVGEINLNKH